MYIAFFSEDTAVRSASGMSSSFFALPLAAVFLFLAGFSSSSSAQLPQLSCSSSDAALRFASGFFEVVVLVFVEATVVLLVPFVFVVVVVSSTLVSTTA
ncbi:hypothetical protein Ct61P_00994 [Colletotrichum tofieldiae]|nr:hypothetical protein Ct61P_00994 [Colletotrichum tofieldiae]